MRYCPNCKKDVHTKWSGGQIFIFIFLLLAQAPLALIYLIFKARKCEHCRGRTRALRPKDDVGDYHE